MVRGNRRRAEIARSAVVSLGIASTTPTLVDVLSGFQTELGLTANPPGMTIGGIHFNLAVRAETTAKTNGFLDFGFIVGPDSLDSADTNPAATTDLHQDWMHLQRRSFGNLALLDQRELVGLGDQGYATVRNKRKLGNINETLWFAFTPNFAGGNSVAVFAFIHAVLILP